MYSRTANPPDVIRKKALIVGLILVVVNAYWVGIASELWYAVYTLVSPFSNAVFTLFVLLALNVLLHAFNRFLTTHRLHPRRTAAHLHYGDDGVHDIRTRDDGDSHGDARTSFLVRKR